MALTDLLVTSAHGIPLEALFALKNGYVELTLAGPVTLANTHPLVTGLDPGGAGRTVTLDGTAVAIGDAAIHGLMRILVNRADAAEDLTVEDALTNAIGTVSQNELGIFYHDGIDADDTAGSGWHLVAIVSIALA